MRSTLRPLVAELIGTFFLVFCGVGAAVSELYRSGTVGFVGIAIANGVALAIGISATMAASGGHVNPAVTIGLWSIGRIDPIKATQYVIAQLAGAIIAVLAVKFLYPDVAGQIAIYGAPRLATDVTVTQGILIEAIMTFLLAFAVMGTIVDGRAPKMGGLGVGLIVVCDVLAGGQMTGAAMNPARAFAPMLVGGMWTGVAIYWVGPVLGAIAAMQIYERVIMQKDS
ncbi:MAG: MIP/aquaporin family protein [Gemmatimonadales bacterium]